MKSINLAILLISSALCKSCTCSSSSSSSVSNSCSSTSTASPSISATPPSALSNYIQYLSSLAAQSSFSNISAALASASLYKTLSGDSSIRTIIGPCRSDLVSATGSSFSLNSADLCTTYVPITATTSSTISTSSVCTPTTTLTLPFDLPSGVVPKCDVSVTKLCTPTTTVTVPSQLPSGLSVPCFVKIVTGSSTSSSTSTSCTPSTTVTIPISLPTGMSVPCGVSLVVKSSSSSSSVCTPTSTITIPQDLPDGISTPCGLSIIVSSTSTSEAPHSTAIHTFNIPTLSTMVTPVVVPVIRTTNQAVNPILACVAPTPKAASCDLSAIQAMIAKSKSGKGSKGKKSKKNALKKKKGKGKGKKKSKGKGKSKKGKGQSSDSESSSDKSISKGRRNQRNNPQRGPKNNKKNNPDGNGLEYNCRNGSGRRPRINATTSILPGKRGLGGKGQRPNLSRPPIAPKPSILLRTLPASTVTATEVLAFANFRTRTVTTHEVEPVTLTATQINAYEILKTKIKSFLVTKTDVKTKWVTELVTTIEPTSIYFTSEVKVKVPTIQIVTHDNYHTVTMKEPVFRTVTNVPPAVTRISLSAVLEKITVTKTKTADPIEVIESVTVVEF